MAERPTPKDWLHSNPNKTLNDYYRLYPQSITYLKAESVSSNYISHTYIPKKKSMTLSNALTFVFGPFGLFYVSSLTALMMLLFPILSFFLYIVTANIANETILYIRMLVAGSVTLILLCYMPICMVIAIYKTHKHNQKEEEKALRSQY